MDPSWLQSPWFLAVGRTLLASIFIVMAGSRLYAMATGADGAFSIGGLVFSLVELAAGVALALGFRTTWVALGLFVFLVVDAVLAHGFWRLAGEAAANQRLHFLKNLSLAGGMLVLAAAAHGRG